MTKDLDAEVYIEVEAYSIELVKRDENIEHSVNLSHLKVLGNPFSNDLKIIHINADERLDIEIYDAIGQLVFRNAYVNQQNISISTSNFTNQGIYFLKSIQNGEEQVQKVIKI